MYPIYRRISSGVFSVHWVTNTTMEIQFPSNSTDTILLFPPTDIPDPDTPCLFTGRLKQEEHSRVTVLGCKDGQKTIITIASTRLPGGLVDFSLVAGETQILGGDDVDSGDYNSNKRNFIFRRDDVLEDPPVKERFRMLTFTGTIRF